VGGGHCSLRRCTRLDSDQLSHHHRYIAALNYVKQTRPVAFGAVEAIVREILKGQFEGGYIARSLPTLERNFASVAYRDDKKDSVVYSPVLTLYIEQTRQVDCT
jgi:hypothetical protein